MQILLRGQIIEYISDYDDFYIATREEADEQIAIAEEFVQMIEKYCKETLGI